MELLMFIFLAVIPVISDGLTVRGPSGPLVAPLGSSVVLPCSVDKPLSVEDLEVEWRRTDSDTLVHLYQDGESRAEAQQQDYQDRVHFFTEEIQRGNFSLRLDNLRAEDEGEYTCTVHSQQDSGETVVEIKDVVRLLVSGSDQSISASVGEDVTLNCSVDSHITPEHIEVAWKKIDENIQVLLFQDNKTLPDSSDERYRDRVEFFTAETPKGNFSLRLKSVRTEDKGVYMCHVFAGGLSANTTTVLEQLGFSVLHIMVLILCVSASGSALLLCCLIYCRNQNGFTVTYSQNACVDLGSSVVLNFYSVKPLQVEGLKVEWRRKDTKALVHLYQDGESRPQQDDQDRALFFTDQIQHGNFSLRLDNVKEEDAGEYICRVYSKQRCVFSTQITLEKDSVLPYLNAKVSSAPLVAPLGSSVVLPCYCGNSLPSKDLKVEWRRKDTLVHLYQDGESRAEAQQQDYQDRAHFFPEEIQHGTFSLRLDNLRAEDEGQYTCKVYSQQESGETVVEIKVDDVERLLVSGSSRSISASVGEDITLNCSIDSHITLEDIEEVSWKKTDEDEDIMVLLYQDQVDLPDSSDERYRDRVEFFTDEIPKLNFSLRLKSVRTEDKGVYMCEVFAGGLSANTAVVLERLGFSVLHIMVLILCISASGSALLLCCLIYCRSPHKGFYGQHTYNQYFKLGSSVVLPCHVDECLLKKKLKVEWRRKDTKTLVHLYQDGESRPQQDYQDRAHFYTDQIQHGNFSLRLDNLRAEDAGEYICKVHSDLFTVTRTAETSLVPQFKVKSSSDRQMVSLGSSVVLPCQVDKSLLQKSLKVEWRRTDSETLVHLYQDGESRAKKQHKDYHQRAHFITDEIKDGNFSLRLEKVRAEDAGKYTCKVYSDQDCKHSADAEVEILRFDVKCSRHTLAPLGSSVVLPSYGDKPLPVEGLKVEWRKAYATVHLYRDGQAKTQHKDYQDRAHFFTDDIQHGNFSLRLENLRAGDEGEYTCTVYSQQESVFSAKTNLVPRLLDVFRLQMSLVFCPNILMFLAFVFWGVSEGSVSETVSCCALYFLRPLLLLWTAPYIDHFTGTIKSLILEYSYVAEYLVLSLVVYSALFTSAWQKLLNYAAFDRAVIIVLFVIVFVCCLCKIIYILVTEVGKKSGRIIKIFDLVADMTFQILPTLQFILLFYTFGAGEAGFIMIVILPVLMMMTNERWLYRCRYGLGFSYSVMKTVMLIFILVTNALMIGLYIFTLDNQTDPIGWGCVMVFLQMLWTVMYFTDRDDYSYLRLSRGFHRYVAVYVFGSVAVVLLNSAALITELILKTVNGDRMMADLRFIVFPSECLFAVSLLISGFSGSKIADCLKSCQNKVRSVRVKRSQKNQSTGETEMTALNTGDQEQNQPDSVLSQT